MLSISECQGLYELIIGYFIITIDLIKLLVKIMRVIVQHRETTHLLAKNPVWLGTDMFIYHWTSLAKNLK